MTTFISLDPDAERRLEALATQPNLTRSQLLTELVARGLAALEATYLGNAPPYPSDLVCTLDARRSDLVGDE